MTPWKARVDREWLQAGKCRVPIEAGATPDVADLMEEAVHERSHRTNM
jgi:hypothetical protein